MSIDFLVSSFHGRQAAFLWWLAFLFLLQEQLWGFKDTGGEISALLLAEMRAQSKWEEFTLDGGEAIER